jgi:hypothetical protein
MPCTRCKGMRVNGQFYDRVDEQGRLSLGAWRWASRCPTCGTMVYEPVERTTADRCIRVEATNTRSVYRVTT